jgi:hypothetical protein
VAPTILNVACPGQQAGPIAPAEEKIGRYSFGAVTYPYGMNKRSE